MPWLLRDGEVLAALEVAPSRRAVRELQTIEGAVLLDGGRPARPRFPVDVAYCRRTDDGLVVVSLKRRWGAACLVLAEAGAFERWKLAEGDTLEVTATS